MNLGPSSQRCHIGVLIGRLTVVAAIVLPSGRLEPQAPHGALTGYALDADDPVQFDLGRSLREISGLAVDRSGRLFAHQDERGIVFQLDPSDGRITKTFRIGRNGVRGDFEGIALAGSRMFLISSDGELVEFGEGADGTSVEYERRNIRSRRTCAEIEGLDYDAAADALLLACKITTGRNLRDRLVVLTLPLLTGELAAEPRFSIPLQFLDRYDLDSELSPSGIAVHPVTRSIFIIAARENLLVELDPAGGVLGVARLRGKSHHQAEGIAFAADGTMYIADEGRSGRATLTVYPFTAPAPDTRSYTGGKHRPQ